MKQKENYEPAPRLKTSTTAIYLFQINNENNKKSIKIKTCETIKVKINLLTVKKLT